MAYVVHNTSGKKRRKEKKGPYVDGEFGNQINNKETNNCQILFVREGK